MREHRMRLYDQAFEKIKAGTQCLELRVNDDKRRSVVKGDRICFIHSQNGQELMTRVLDRFDYPDFFLLYQDLNPADMGYGPGDRPDPRDMYALYPPSLIQEKGVVAFRIRLLDPEEEGG